MSSFVSGLRDLEYRRYATNFGAYFKTEGFRSDGKVNALFLAEVVSGGLHSMISGGEAKDSKLAAWFGGLQAIKGLFSLAAANESVQKGKYVHAVYEFFFWGADAVKKGIEASGYEASDSTMSGIGAVRNLGALAGVISSYEEVKQAWANYRAPIAEKTTSLGHAVETENVQKGCDIMRLAGASLLLAWTAMQLVGKEFKKIEGALTALRVSYALMDMAHYVVEESARQIAEKKD